MGAINYKSGNQITLGMNAIDEDEEYISISLFNICSDILEEYEPTGYFCSCLYTSIEFGYYYGFSISLDFENIKYFDEYGQKMEHLEDAKELEKIFLRCIEAGLFVTFPGWVDVFLNYDESIKYAKQVFSKLRGKIRKIPCYRTLERKGLIC